jgi:HK97 family phage portal protein
MKLLGFEITRSKKQYTNLVGDRGNWWWPIVHEPYTGAWQHNMELRTESIMAYHAVYACLERIASDVAKCELLLVEQDANGIWNEVDVAAFSPVIRKPNSFQTRIQFFENWILSKLLHGNTYVLKGRDSRNVVTDLYVLDPLGVKVYVAPTGDVIYQLNRDNLSGLETDNVHVPASEIIHDMMTLKHHPLCGLPPMAPAALSAKHGLQIQHASVDFFRNQARPSGVLTAPGIIQTDTAKRLKEYWDQNFTGERVGKIAVLGDGLKFEPMMVNAVDAQLIEQLNMTAKMVCSSFGVPTHMIGVSDPPTHTNIEALNQQYYMQTIQKFFESIELLLDEGLGLADVPGHVYGTEFDKDDLYRMDTASMVDTMAKGVIGGIIKPNEARRKLGYGSVPGGDTPYLQQQNYSLAALNKRDSQDNPFAPATPQAQPGSAQPSPDSPPAASPAPDSAPLPATNAIPEDAWASIVVGRVASNILATA